MHTAENIKRLRLRACLSQEELAELLGVARTIVTRFENGTKSPSAALVVEMAKIFGVTTDEILLKK